MLSNCELTTKPHGSELEAGALDGVLFYVISAAGKYFMCKQCSAGKYLDPSFRFSLRNFCSWHSSIRQQAAGKVQRQSNDPSVDAASCPSKRPLIALSPPLSLLPIVIEGAAGEDGHNGYSIVAGVKERERGREGN